MFKDKRTCKGEQKRGGVGFFLFPPLPCLLFYASFYPMPLCILCPLQCCQVSQIIRETPDFRPYLPVSVSDISSSRGSAKFRYFREIPQNSPQNAKYREFRQKYLQILVGKTSLILILAIRPVLFTPNVQIYLETSSLQRVNNVPKLPGVFR